MKTTVSYVPTVCLKHVVAAQVWEGYLKGDFASTAMPNHTLHRKGTYVPVTSGEVRMFRDKNNSLHTIYLTNHAPIRQLLSYHPRCFWCMEDLDLKKTDEWVPIVYQMTRVWNETSFVNHFLAENHCCSFECALAYLRHYGYGIGAAARTSHQTNGEAAIHALYELMYPAGDDLQEAPSFRLLTSLGGTMSIEEFKQVKHVFVPSPILIIHGASQPFISMSNRKK